MTVDRVRVFFELEQDSEGYPPAGTESVWARSTNVLGRFVVDNIPFFARQATFHDLVVAHEDNGNHWFDEIAERSGNSLVRVVFFDEELFPTVNSHLVSIGCGTEYLESRHLLAVNVPPETEYREVIRYLIELGEGVLDYEEAIIGQE